MKLTCDSTLHRGDSGKAKAANVKKTSLIRAEWNATLVTDRPCTARAKVVDHFLMEHCKAHCHYAEEQRRIAEDGWALGRGIVYRCYYARGWAELITQGDRCLGSLLSRIHDNTG